MAQSRHSLGLVIPCSSIDHFTKFKEDCRYVRGAISEHLIDDLADVVMQYGVPQEIQTHEPDFCTLIGCDDDDCYMGNNRYHFRHPDDPSDLKWCPLHLRTYPPVFWNGCAECNCGETIRCYRNLEHLQLDVGSVNQALKLVRCHWCKTRVNVKNPIRVQFELYEQGYERASWLICLHCQDVAESKFNSGIFFLTQEAIRMLEIANFKRFSEELVL